MVANVLLHVQMHVNRIVVPHVADYVRIHVLVVKDVPVDVRIRAKKDVTMNVKVDVVAHVRHVVVVAAKDAKDVPVVAVDVKAVTIAVWAVLVVMNYVQACV